MPCLSYRQIKRNADVYGVARVFHPCGSCESCQSSLHHSWSWRLAAELETLKKKYYRIAFVTLSYSPQALPVLPAHCFAGQRKRVPRVPCFFRPDVRTFVNSLRKYWNKKVNGRYRSIKYFLTSEYGDNTHRPHYHLLLAVPTALSLDEQGEPLVQNEHDLHEFYLWIKDYWTNRYGLIFPREKFYFGGYDVRGHWHNGFEVAASIDKTAYYCAKYVCKDDAWHKHVESRYKLIPSRHRKDYRPFHLQSKSLGLCAVAGLTDSQKMAILKDGLRFGHSTKNASCPLYIKNHLLFNTEYVYKIENGVFKRLPHRVVSKFFIDNSLDLYKMRLASSVEMFKNIIDVDYRRVNKVYEKVGCRYEKVSRLLEKYSVSEVADFYTLYYGLDYQHCPAVDRHSAFVLKSLFSGSFTNSELRAWALYFLRTNTALQGGAFFRRLQMYLEYFQTLPLISAKRYEDLTCIITYMLSLYRFVDETKPDELSRAEKLRLSHLYKGLLI